MRKPKLNIEKEHEKIVDAVISWNRWYIEKYVDGNGKESSAGFG